MLGHGRNQGWLCGRGPHGHAESRVHRAPWRLYGSSATVLGFFIFKARGSSTRVVGPGDTFRQGGPAQQTWPPSSSGLLWPGRPTTWTVGDLCPLPSDLVQIPGGPSGSSEVTASPQGPCLPTSRGRGSTTTPVLCPPTEMDMHVPLRASLLPATPLLIEAFLNFLIRAGALCPPRAPTEGTSFTR